MITAVDTNVFLALWNRDDSWNQVAESLLDRAFGQGGLVVAAPVYCELLSLPGRTEAFLDTFLHDNSIMVDWDITETIWRQAGRAFRSYAARNRRRTEGPRRILADFVIGAHALERGYRLLTFDQRIFRASFPALQIIRE